MNDEIKLSKYNNGVYLTEDGHAWTDETLTKEVEYIYENGYIMVPNKYLIVKDSEGTGQYLHRMMVYAFGDRNGNPYTKGLVIDHINMNHYDNSVQNLEIVPTFLNLWRAVVGSDFKSVECINRFNDCMKNIRETCGEEIYEYTRDIVRLDSEKRWGGRNED